jgi:thiosulfate/3-mercaptopyruvate sulfurtransferase
MYASRLWWLALWLGHARAAVLDGGLRAWRAAGHPLSRDIPRAAPARFTVREPLVATIDASEIEQALGTPRLRVIDARAPERYRGDVEPLDAKAGHIPGALNRPFKANVDAEGRFKPRQALRTELEPLVRDVPANALVSQCGSGVTACHNILAMAAAGLPLARLYPGSWSEWSSSPARPVATGDTP